MRKCIYTLLIACGSLAAHAQWTTICNTGNGFVVDLAAYNGDVYSTGFFTHDCGTSANHINKWNGITWTAVDTGLDDAGHRICVIGTEMYVAKYQQAIDSNWVYKWDGSHFAKFGASIYLTNAAIGFSKTANIYDIVQYHGDIIISGEFDRADGKAISGIARWTGTTWDSLGSGLSGLLSGYVMYPHQMMVYNDTLYVIGNFQKAGGLIVNGVAKWDGTQWHAMGAGFNKEVYAVAAYNGAVYVAGGFTRSGTTTLRHVAMWNGSDWVSAGFEVYSNLSFDESYVHTLKKVGTRLFVSGGFLHVITAGDTVSCGNIIAWDGANVSTLGGGTPNYQIEGMIPYGTNSVLVSGGYNNDSSYVASYNLDALAVPWGVKPEVRIYPVPAQDKICIEGAQEGSSIDIYDMQGRSVYSTISVAGAVNVDISGITAGPYVVRLQSRDGMPYTKMIFKQ